jgi:hypothetical protein
MNYELPASNIWPHLKIISVDIFFDVEEYCDGRNDKRRSDSVHRVAEKTDPIVVISTVVLLCQDCSRIDFTCSD